MKDLSHLGAKEKLFRLGIGLRMVIAHTRDSETKLQLESYLKQFGL